MIKMLITDLDDTLYPWVEFFVPAFYAMADEVSRIIETPKKQVICEYREVHKNVHSVEYPYATLLLPSVKKAFPMHNKQQLIDKLNPAFHLFNSVRKKNLRLYPFVHETLAELSKMNISIVGYTESAEENGYYRLKKLGIDSLFEKVYVSNSLFHGYDYLNSPIKIEKVSGSKPNPDLLLQICSNQGYNQNEVIYVGDSLTKDILMAQKAGVVSILCQYPKSTDYTELYSKLVAISSWTEEDFIYNDYLTRQ